ncbi:recombination, repair and ssDNA binding protein [Enterobacter phage vB_Ent31]|uniref:Recombination, repair and ssDNA binding protein n=1 Tax=Enterobacter phage myPSH1140 TaxID=2108137 RepID=A0A2R3ZXB4_9CAUD|nr:recombination, repair and ssDNA binding protein [Enterobacter phage myPSH1140]AVR55373.1 recombination, repair and ssDNA binding protein [Enterobacter phage myPSH1140]WOF01332.1 recombination, repair and ssDNA binding protein [Enterobacter phage vB_Ent31]
MKLEELQEELKQDLIIDSTKLQYESANNPVLYGKWLTKLSAIRKEMLRIEASKKSALKQKLDYYTGRGDGDEFSMDRYEKSEMKTVLSADKEVLRIDTSLQYWGILLEFCRDAMDAIKSRGFSIKHIIEMRKFEAGE